MNLSVDLAVELRPRAWRVLGATVLTIGILTTPPSVFLPPTFAAQPPAPAPAPTKPKEDETVVLQSSKPMTATTGQWQKWDDYISIKQGQEHAPLNLVFENGS